MHAALIYPHQLFAQHPAVDAADICVLVEEPLFFTQYAFHVQKLVLHRATMRAYADRLQRIGKRVEYLSIDRLRDTADVAAHLKRFGIGSVECVDLCDDWLTTRLQAALSAAAIPLHWRCDPHFLTPRETFEQFAAGRRKLLFTDFYIQQRRRLGLLLDSEGKPIGGKWSFDPENRKKLPRNVALPAVRLPPPNDYVGQAAAEIARDFPNAPGDRKSFAYPVTHEQAADWLGDFLDHRLADFGPYEDAIDRDASVLFHSLLTPALNSGLISPREVVDAALRRADHVPLSSLEGFVRQVIGWREYIRGVYLVAGRRQRSRNFWGHRQPLPPAFYKASTGIEPVDTVICRVLATAYCHHIERLMILGNFMLLCEIDPNAIYRWFMELFIDAYDWVMVPNVYGMSQHADGGLITTKPYLSGSSYVLRMSNFRKGPWCEIWDALYWRFIDRHRAFFAANPRMAVITRQCDRLGPRLAEHRRIAARFLAELHGRDIDG